VSTGNQDGEVEGRSPSQVSCCDARGVSRRFLAEGMATTQHTDGSEGKRCERREEEGREGDSDATRRRRELRKENLRAEPWAESDLKKLDSSIKKNTSVIKKLKNVTEEGKDGILKDIVNVNLSKYVTEAVDAVAEGKPKSADILATVEVCCLLHRRYAEFSSNLTKALVQTFNPSKQKDDEKQLFGRKRSHLRLLVELLLVGVIKDPLPLLVVVKSLENLDFTGNQELAMSNLSLLVSFLKQGGRELLQETDGRPQDDELSQQSTALSAPQRQKMLSMLQKGWEASANAYLELNAKLRDLESHLSTSAFNRGVPSNQHDTSYDEARKAFDTLHRSLQVFAELLDRSVPELPESDVTRIGQESSTSTEKPLATADVANGDSPFEDDASISFYERFPDLKDMLPHAILVKYVGTEAGKDEEKHRIGDTNQDDNQPNSDPQADSDTYDGKSQVDDGNKNDAQSSCSTLCKSELKDLLGRLPQCLSRDLADQFALDFCLMTSGPSKGARKRLVQTMCSMDRRQLEVLPYIARIVAVLSTCFRDISPLLCSSLEEEFHYLAAKKDQINLDSRIRNIRLLCELCKFKVVGTNVIFACLQSCLDDFTHHNVDVACSLLEACGRYLYRLPESHTRMSNMLEVFMRLGRVKNLETRQNLLVENAYFQCRPPERSASKVKQRSSVHQYVRYLILSMLNQSNVQFVVKQLRKLDWEKEENFVVRCILKVHKNKYSQIRLVAKVVQGVSHYHESLGIQVIDEAWEELRFLIENITPQGAQRRIACMKLFGELYTCRIVDFEALLVILYFILNHRAEGAEASTTDPLDNFARVRMVITLLETCSMFFSKGQQKQLLERFLLHFQRYCLYKAPLPMDIEYDLQDLYSSLNSKRYQTVEEIDARIKDTEAELASPQHSAISTDKPNTAMMDEMVNDGRGSGEEDDGVFTMSEEDVGRDQEDVLQEDEDASSHVSSSATDGESGEMEEEEEEEDYVVQPQARTVSKEEEESFDREMNLIVGEVQNMSASRAPSLTMFGSAAHTDITSSKEKSKLAEDVPVKMVLKKGSKQQMHQLFVPVQSGLVQSAIQRKREEKEERDHLKQLVLEAHQRNLGETGHMGSGHVYLNSAGPTGLGKGT